MSKSDNFWGARAGKRCAILDLAPWRASGTENIVRRVNRKAASEGKELRLALLDLHFSALADQGKEPLL